MRACALVYGSSRDDNLPYAEFSYDNSYQASLKMAPFEALYGRRSQTLLMWDEVGDCQLFGPNVIKESWHYLSRCPKRKPRYLSEVICFSGNGAGHFARECPKEKETCAR